MKTTSLLRSLITAALLMCGSAYAAESAIQVVREQGAPVAQFQLGDSHCVLKNDQIRCMPPAK